MTDRKTLDTFLNRESRYTGQDERTLVVTVTRQSTSEVLTGTVVNLSLRGAKLILAQPLSFTEAIRLELDLANSLVGFDIPAKICWTRPVGDGTYSVGCAFGQRLTSELLNSLSELGYLERREHGRMQIDVPALSKWELSDSCCEVSIRDYSTGGFAMVARQRAQADQQVMVEIPTDQQNYLLSARVVWQTRTEDNYRIGCSFIGKKDAETMARAVQAFYGDASTPCQPSLPARTTRYSSAALVGLIVATTIASQQLNHHAKSPTHTKTAPISIVPPASTVASVAPQLQTTPGGTESRTPHHDPAPSLTTPLLSHETTTPTSSPSGSSEPVIEPNSSERSDGDTTELDNLVRGYVNQHRSGQTRAALTDLGQAIRQSPRDPAFRYVIASVAYAAGFHKFAEVQFNLGWTLERRYPESSPLRPSDLLTADENAWLSQKRAERDGATP